MAITTDLITVDPQGVSMVVDIKDSYGNSVTCYTASGGSSTFTLPVTISTATDFHLTGGGYYTVSAKLGGTEIAGAAGQPATVQAAQGVPVRVVPVLDQIEQLEGADSGGSSTPPTSPVTNQLWYDSNAELWKRWNGSAWVAEGYAAYVARAKSTLKSTFATAGRIDPAGNSLQIIGVDLVDNRMFAVDHSSGDFVQSTDWGSTHEWGSKGYPTGSDHSSIDSMIRFGGNLYAVARDTSTGAVAVWRTPPALGNIGVPPAVPYTWTSVKSLASGSNESAGPLLAADSNYIYATEYGNPSGGPSVYRSPDGTTWTRVYGPDATVLHAHCLWTDPYNPGHVWLTLGDGTAHTIMRSTDSGTTWSVIVADSAWQAVQISGDANYIYLAADTGQSTFNVIRRSDLVPLIGSPNFHYNFAVPGAAASTDRYYQACYYGAVDPATGVYYCVANDSSKPGNKSGLFYAPMVGAPLQILDPSIIAGKVFIAGGYVLHGAHRHPLIAY